MPEPSQLHRDMGCTRAEFMGWLPGATRQAPFQIDGDKVTVITHGGRVQISLEEKPPRRIGAVALPCSASPSASAGWTNWPATISSPISICTRDAAAASLASSSAVPSGSQDGRLPAVDRRQGVQDSRGAWPHDAYRSTGPRA